MAVKLLKFHFRQFQSRYTAANKNSGNDFISTMKDQWVIGVDLVLLDDFRKWPEVVPTQRIIVTLDPSRNLQTFVNEQFENYSGRRGSQEVI